MINGVYYYINEINDLLIYKKENENWYILDILGNWYLCRPVVSPELMKSY